MSAPTLAQLVQIGQSDLKAQYGNRLRAPQHQALRAIADCRSGDRGQLQLSCPGCGHQELRPRSCGHRSCPQCQHHTTVEWLQRQSAKRLPVDYFLVTFTLPAQLRGVAQARQEVVYDALMKAAASTLQSFGQNHKLHVQLGLVSVLHTHSRRLDFHPHVHVVVPGGGIDKTRRQWKKFKGQYLFNEFQLATVFRARLLQLLGLANIALPHGITDRWVVHCLCVGNGLPALQYLSRYLYRGVISNRQILDFDPASRIVRFRYIDAKIHRPEQRSLPIADFLWTLLQHVLPPGFHRVREYGFLHAKAKATLRLVQLVLRVMVAAKKVSTSIVTLCRHCQTPLRISVPLQIRPTPS